MNIDRFNRSLRAARITIEQHRPTLEAAYEGLIREAAREASTAFVRTTQTTTVASADQPSWQIPPNGVLLAVLGLIDRSKQKLSDLHQRVFQQMVGPPLSRAGIAWDITSPLSQMIIEQSAQRTGEMLGSGVSPLLREIVLNAYNKGLSVPNTATLIRDKIGEAAPGQAKMLARSDLNSLANGGSHMAAQMVGAKYQRWLSAEDAKVRPTHAAADGEIVPVGQSFTVGGELALYPGDPSLSDAEACNCRCTLVYMDSADVKNQTASGYPLAPVRSGGIMDEMRDRVPARGFMAKQPEPPARIPGRGFAAAAVTVTVDQPMAADPTAWSSDIAFEGAATEDGRYILPGALSWRDLPLSLMALTETSGGGHEGAFVAGRIDSITKSATDMNGDKLPAGMAAVRASGVFDVGGVDGGDVARMVEEQMMRGVSVDLSVEDWCFRDAGSGDLIEQDQMTPMDVERAMMGELQYAVRAGTIMGATVCPMPAFADARIAVTASGDRIVRFWFRASGGCVAAVADSFSSDVIAYASANQFDPRDLIPPELITASAAGLAPAQPPAEWFTTPEADDPTPLTVTKDGRVFGHMALWDSCHTGYPGQCVPPPRSPSGYAYFNLGEVECSDGSRVACGAITLEALHADSDRPVSPDAVRAHYEHTGVVGAFVRAVDGRHGIWVAGALRASLSERHARDLMGAKPSGDWRQMRPGGPLEMLGVHAVNEPGFPVPRLAASALLPSGLRAELLFAEPDENAAPARIPARGFATAAA